MNEEITVLIVEDSLVFSKIIESILDKIPGLRVVGKANNGKEGLDKIDKLKPDLVTLDVEMPQMSGIELLKALPEKKPDIVMISSITKRGAATTIEALSLGAFDFITKPAYETFDKNYATMRSLLLPLLNAYKNKKRMQMYTSETAQEECDIPKKHIEAVAIGISTGGPKTLIEVIPKLPESFPVPIFIVQHMPALFTRELAMALDIRSKITVVEASNGMEVQAGNIYIAPGGKQMKITKTALKKIISITNDGPLNHCLPSYDYFLESAIKVYASSLLGVVMTGMGTDGAKNLLVLKNKGGIVFAQNKETSVVYGMAQEAANIGAVSKMIPLQKLACEIIQYVN